MFPIKKTLNTPTRYLLLGGVVQILMIIWAATRNMALSYLPVAATLIFLYIVTDQFMIHLSGNRRLAAYLYLLCSFGCIFQTFLSSYLTTSSGSFIISVAELAENYLIFYALTLISVPLFASLQQKFSNTLWIIVFWGSSLFGFILLFFLTDTNIYEQTKVRISISLFGHSIQIMEFIKLGIVLTFGFLFSSPLEEKKKVCFSFCIFAISSILLVICSEFGTLLIVAVTFFALLLMFTDSYKPAICLIIFILLCLLLLWLGQSLNIGIAVDVWNKLDARIFRAWLNPENYADTAGNQILAARKAASLGGWLGCSAEEMIYYRIPVEDSDMIFLKMLSAGGITLAGLVLLLFFLIFRECFYISILIRKDTKGIIVTTLCIMIFAQVLLILCGSIGLLPLTGVPLIFIGHGGMSLFSSILIFGFILFCSSKKWRD